MRARLGVSPVQDSGGSHKVAEAGHSRGKWWRRAGGIPTPSIGPVLRRVGPAAPPVSTLRRSTHHAELQPRSPDPGAHWGSPVHHSPATSAWFRSTVLSLAERGCSHCATRSPGAQALSQSGGRQRRGTRRDGAHQAIAQGAGNPHGREKLSAVRRGRRVAGSQGHISSGCLPSRPSVPGARGRSHRPGLALHALLRSPGRGGRSLRTAERGRF